MSSRKDEGPASTRRNRLPLGLGVNGGMRPRASVRCRSRGRSDVGKLRTLLDHLHHKHTQYSTSNIDCETDDITPSNPSLKASCLSLFIPSSSTLANNSTVQPATTPLVFISHWKPRSSTHDDTLPPVIITSGRNLDNL
jgi:hypothetical protein